MSEPLPERADVRQLRIQAKELLRALQNGDQSADGLDPAKVKLADAQRLIARKYGFSSWPKLVDQVETPALLEQFQNAVHSGDAAALETLLKSMPNLRKHINDPIFSFDSPAIVPASRNPRAKEIVPILIRYGADPNQRTGWWAGGFGALDHADDEVTDLLLNLGAKFDVWSAASHGRVDVLRQLLDQDPSLVNAPGGDGMRPLHFAANAETAEFLIERGADLEQRDVDHEGTPIQYQVQRPEVLRVLLAHGAKPDVFTAVALDDPDLLRQILKDDPKAIDARVGQGEFVTKKSNGGHIYAYTAGPTMTPHQFAAKLGHQKVEAVLLEHAAPARRLLVAALREDAKEVDAILAAHPDAGRDMGPDARALADAAQEGRAEAVRLLLKAGVDPTAPGMDSGSALHTACWFGYIDVVRLLVDRVPLDLCDAVHGSPPLGWTAHGSQWCRNPKGDYVAVARLLLEKGADPTAPANKFGVSMLDQAGKREDVKAVLREFGAS
ncbi:MAG: ankyrin repeat domain-containing protein [Armatimonadetes bacterium]|nr:ankyrin repeat domain-containing protein [Armatimonadota bacterium]